MVVWFSFSCDRYVMTSSGHALIFVTVTTILIKLTPPAAVGVLFLNDSTSMLYLLPHDAHDSLV